MRADGNEAKLLLYCTCPVAEGLAVDASGHCELRRARVEREPKRVRRVRRQRVREAVADCGRAVHVGRLPTREEHGPYRSPDLRAPRPFCSVDIDSTVCCTVLYMYMYRE